MARGYRAREDGLFEVETPGLGFVPVHWGEDQLRAQGLEPMAPPEGRQAFVGDTPQAPSAPPAGGQARAQAPESRLDAGKPSTMAGDFSRYLETSGGFTPAEEFPANFRDDLGATPGVRDLLKDKKPSDLILEGATDKLPEKAPPTSKSGPKTEPYRPGGGAQMAAGGGGPGRRRYHTSKARDQRVAFRVDKGPQLDPENEELRSEAEIDTRLAMQQEADREEQRAGERVEQFESRVLAPLEKQISADEIKLDRMRQDYAKRQREIDDERAAIDKLEVDPNRLFSEKGAWASVLAGISILAGGALQGLQGRGDNPGLTAVNNAIDRDIQLQKDQYARRREGLQAKETAFERLVEKYGNPEMAEAELRNRQSSLAEAWAKHHMMKGASEDVQLNLQKAFNDRDLARVEERRQLDQAFGDRITEQWQHIPAQTVQVGGSRPIKQKDRALAVVLPGGKVKFGRSDVDARAAREKITAGVHLSNLLGNVKAMVERGKGDRLWWDENRGNIQANMTAIAATYKDSEKLGTFDAGVERLLSQGVGDPSALLSWDDATIAKLEENQRLQQAKIDNISNYELDDTPDSITPGAGSTFRAESDR